MRLYFFIPLIFILVAVGAVGGIIKLLKFYHAKKNRRSPFTEKFLRAPGQSLLQAIEDVNMELAAYIMMMVCMPFILYGALVSDLYFREKQFNVLFVWPYIVIALAFWGYFLFKMVRLFNSRRAMRLGYDGEVATGQELNRMMLQGYYVYHDFVADKFNIDHIAIGPAGVFAVETKGRAKPVSGKGAADAKVIYDGKRLQFPKWIEVKPLEQAKNQAQWLERWLSSATGEKTYAQPVLALPGWYVERISSDGIPVINPKLFKSIVKPVNGIVLDERRIKSIVHQIEQRCKNIESRAVEGLGGSVPE